MNHKISSYVLVMFMIFGISIIASAITSDELDEICSDNERILYRTGGFWQCAILNNTGSSGNVTSVTSSTNCITVSPVSGEGDVVLTFNTSCAGSGGGGDFYHANFSLSFNTSLNAQLPLENRTRSHISNITGFLYNYNETTAIFTMILLNTTIDQRINLNPSGFITSNIGNNTYYLITNPNNYINLTTGQALNNTNLIYSSFQNSFNINLTGVLPLENRTRSHISNITGFLYNYNTTTTSLPLTSITGLDHNACSSSNFVTNITFTNGVLTITCDAPLPTVPSVYDYNHTNVVFSKPLLNQTIDLRIGNHTQFSNYSGHINRAINTNYQNTRGKSILVYGSIRFAITDLSNEPSYAIIYTGTSNPPNIPRQKIGFVDVTNLVAIDVALWDQGYGFNFIVENGSYYNITHIKNAGATATLEYWNEVDL